MKIYDFQDRTEFLQMICENILFTSYIVGIPYTGALVIICYEVYDFST